MDTEAGTPTIVLVHGLWVTPLSWEHWIERYSAQGYEVIAPAWPGMDGDVEQLRADTSAFDNVGVTDVVDHYDAQFGLNLSGAQKADLVQYLRSI